MMNLIYLLSDPEHADKIKEIMESAVELEVPNKVDYESGPNWGHNKIMFLINTYLDKIRYRVLEYFQKKILKKDIRYKKKDLIFKWSLTKIIYHQCL